MNQKIKQNIDCQYFKFKIICQFSYLRYLSQYTLMKKCIIISISILIFFQNCKTSNVVDKAPILNAKTAGNNRPKNIILMIGDGMGLSQITAIYYQNKGKSNFLRFPYVGLHINYPAEDSTVITDSAAGATAFACGVKTYNAAIGVDKDTVPVETILETAEKKGMATGLVATCNIQHATPASFIAHVKSRSSYEDISEDFLKTTLDIGIGGGKKYFDNRTKDSRNLLKELEQKGYMVSDWTKKDIDDLPMTGQNLFYLTANDQPLTAEQGRDYLPKAAKFACKFLDKRSSHGFFLMIEGSQIDWGGHAGNTNYILNEMNDFDNTIGEVLDYAKRDGNTLVIVTADHETGGFALTKGTNWGKVVGGFGDTMPDKNGSRYHTCDFIPVFAFGPGAELFTGVYQNHAIYHKMKMLFGF
jgi:alkaline phosphatase